MPGPSCDVFELCTHGSLIPNTDSASALSPAAHCPVEAVHGIWVPSKTSVSGEEEPGGA